MGPTSNDWCLYKEGEEHRDTQREETVKAEAEMGVTALQTKEATSCQEPPGARMDGLFSRAFKGSMALLTP